MTAEDWPVGLRGVTESVVTTRESDGCWNAAALGLHAGEPVTAVTWGRTRTRRNFERTAAGVVQFVDDPVRFVEAALGVVEVDDPVLPSAAAWARVEAERVGAGEESGTPWVEWGLRPVESVVERRTVPVINRGFNAVIEASVAASRLDVDACDRDQLVRRLEFLTGVIERCGGSAELEALDRLRSLAAY